MNNRHRLDHIRLSASIALILLIFTTGCARQEEPPAVQPIVEASTISITAVDALGRAVTLERPAERIMAAGKATMIVADALYLFPDARSKVVGLGITNQGLGDFFELIAPELGPSERLDHSVGAEEIAAAQPDLVLIKSRNYESLGVQLEKLGIQVFTLDLESPESYIAEITQLGILLQEEDRAAQITTYYQGMIDQVETAVKEVNSEEKERVLLLYGSLRDGVTAFQTSPETWIQTIMTETAGADALWKEANGTAGWQKVNFEQIAAWDPQRIYLISYKIPVQVFLDQIEASELWQDLSAVTEGDVKAFPADYHNWAQPDTRWILGLRWLSMDLHPELYGQEPFTDTLLEFYRTMYGITDQDVLQEIIERYEASIN